MLESLKQLNIPYIEINTSKSIIMNSTLDEYEMLEYLAEKARPIELQRNQSKISFDIGGWENCLSKH